jgi:hypothetical protein
MSKTLTQPKPYATMSETERETFQATLFTPEKMVQTAQKLAQEYAETNDSIYAADPRYPGEVLEWTPEGQVFIVQKHQAAWIRIREVL